MWAWVDQASAARILSWSCSNRWPASGLLRSLICALRFGQRDAVLGMQPVYLWRLAARLQSLAGIGADTFQHSPTGFAVHPRLAIQQTLAAQSRNARLWRKRQVVVGIADCLYGGQAESAGEYTQPAQKSSFSRGQELIAPINRPA